MNLELKRSSLAAVCMISLVYSDSFAFLCQFKTTFLLRTFKINWYQFVCLVVCSISRTKIFLKLLSLRKRKRLSICKAGETIFGLSSIIASRQVFVHTFPSLTAACVCVFEILPFCFTILVSTLSVDWSCVTYFRYSKYTGPWTKLMCNGHISHFLVFEHVWCCETNILLH